MEHTKANKVYFLLNFFLSLTFLFVIFINSIGYNLLTFNKKWSFELQFLFPQGWGFFTKDPREDQTTIYKEENNSLKELDLKNGAPNSWLGMTRKNRIMLIELIQIINQVDSSNWKGIDSKEKMKAFTDTTKAIEVINFVNNAQLEGNFFVIKQKPVPWSWRANKNNLFMPAKGIKLKLKKL